MNSQCDQIRDLIADSITGVLTAEQAKRLDEHLAQCADCRRYAEALRREDRLLGELVAGVAAAMPGRKSRLLQVLGHHQFKQDTHLMTWRKIMRSPVTRLTAAGLTIAALIIAVSTFSGTTVKAVEFSEITKAMGQAPWMHGTTLVKMPKMTGTIELWIGFEAKIQAGRMPDGKVSFLDPKAHEKAEYDPGSNTITLSYAEEDEFSAQVSSPGTMLESMHRLLKEHGAQIVARMGDYRGRKVQVQEASLSLADQRIDRYTMTLYVDPQSKLLYAMDAKASDANGVILSDQGSTYDYPPTGPKDIYDLGVPRDARVVDKRPSKGFQAVWQDYQRVRAEATSEYIAVIAHHEVNLGDVVTMIDVDQKSGQNHRQERHSVFHTGEAFDRFWPTYKEQLGDSFESLLAWTRQHYDERGYISIHLYDGQYNSSTGREDNGAWSKLSKDRSSGGDLGPLTALGDLAWPQILPGAQIIQDEYAAEHKLVCIERLQQGQIYNGRVSLPGRFLHYLDPAWGYLCRRKVTEWRPDAGWQENKHWLNGVDPNTVRDGSIIIADITEAFQAINGHWYPKTIVEQSSGTRKDYRELPLRTRTIKHVYVTLSPEFVEGAFDIDKLPGQ